MIEQIKEKANEVSMMLVMTSEGDLPGITMVLELCEDLSKLASATSGQERLTSAVQFLVSKSKSADILSLLQEFASTASQYLEGSTNVCFPNEKEFAGTIAKSSDLAESIDPRFLTEFIESHSLLLEDFESSILDAMGTEHGSEDFGVGVKRYLHNLKGDAGSIGLLGVEKVCHVIEDALTHNSAAELVPQLLMFKEWVVQCLKSVSNGAIPKPSSDEFLKGLVELLSLVSDFGEAAIPVATDSPACSHQPKTEAVLGEYTMSGEMDILVEFAAEAEEHLNNVESVILDAEGNYSKDAIDMIFRGVHSIKGGSAYFGIEEMTKCSHILENFLSEIRDEKRKLDPQLSGLLLTYIDLQKNILVRAKDAATKNGVITRAQASVDMLESLEAYKNGKSLRAANLPLAATTPETVGAAQPKAAETKAPTLAAPREDRPDANSDKAGDKLSVKTFVKVETARLDHLIDSIGEMVIYSSMLIRHCRELLDGHEGVMDATHRVEKFSRDLQDIGMSMRLVPIKGLFQKMSRLVWDTSKKLSKDITFVMEGEDTELDRNLIDKLADPLMHMVRNSLDHGIETPEEREKKGKSCNGTVKLSAYHSGGSIHIKIQDDGKGLDPEKLIAKAIEKGILQEGQKISDSEAFRLIFAAGFSTAAVVTDISGRGVGMDVVRRNVESLRGRIHIESKVNEGSTFTIELPLTLAIIDGIQIQIGTESFLIPSLSIIEFVKPKKEMITDALDRGETLHFRGRYLPIYRVADLYNIESRYDCPIDATMVIVENNHEQVALMVDDILGECSTVIKNLGSVFEEGKGIAGCAIMPQGNVALILDIGSLVNLARREYRREPSTAIENALQLMQ